MLFRTHQIQFPQIYNNYNPSGQRSPSPDPQPFHHQLSLMSAGLSTKGSSKWHTTSIAIGKMQGRSVMRQLYGANLAMYTITAMLRKQMKNVPLNFLRTRTTSLPKTTFSASFAVAPHDMSISNEWHSIDCIRWSDNPPRKMVKKGVHRMFLLTVVLFVLSVYGVPQVAIGEGWDGMG